MSSVERISDNLEAPSLDDRSYRVVRLPNRLEALLVHDPDTDKASASVNVNVGSFSDADDMPGMAHAVEHLLFMGTEKVPVLHEVDNCLLIVQSFPKKMTTTNICRPTADPVMHIQRPRKRITSSTSRPRRIQTQAR